MRLSVLLYVLGFLIVEVVSANDALWIFQQQKEVAVKGQRKIIPDEYILVQLNDSLFKQVQRSMPLEQDSVYVELGIPAPDGSIRMFQMRESASMSVELAEKYPFLKTYTGIEKNNKIVAAKMDYTEFGFHAMVLDGDNTYFIDPYSDVNTGYYSCYYKKNYNKLNKDTQQKKPVYKKSCKRHKCRLK